MMSTSPLDLKLCAIFVRLTIEFSLQSSSHAALVRCFQLAFSLRRMSLNQESKFILICLLFKVFAFVYQNDDAKKK